MTERPENGDGRDQGDADQTHRAAGGEPGTGTSLRQGLGIQVQVGRESSHRPAGTNLTCRTSPDLKCDAGVQSVKDNLSRSNVAFARNGFAERAQNGQRVGVRSPVGAPDNWGIRDVLAKKGGQVGAIMLKFGLDPGLSAVNTSLGGVCGGSKWRHPQQCRHCPKPR